MTMKLFKGALALGVAAFVATGVSAFTPIAEPFEADGKSSDLWQEMRAERGDTVYEACKGFEWGSCLKEFVRDANPNRFPDTFTRESDFFIEVGQTYVLPVLEGEPLPPQPVTTSVLETYLAALAEEQALANQQLDDRITAVDQGAAAAYGKAFGAEKKANEAFVTAINAETVAKTNTATLQDMLLDGKFLGIPLKWLAVGAVLAAALAFAVGLIAFFRSRKARRDALVANQKADSTAAMVGELEDALSEKADVSAMTALTSRVEAVEQAVTDQRERIAHLEGLVISRDAEGRFVGLNQEEVDLMVDGESLPLPVYGFDDEDEDVLVRVDMVMHRPLDGPAYVTFDGLKSGKHKLDTTKVVPIFRYLLKAEEMRWVDGTTPYDEAATVAPAAPVDPFAEADDDADQVFGTNVPSTEALNRLRAAVAANRGQPTPAGDSDPDGDRVAIPSFLRMRGMAEARNDD